eukprot:2901146-Pyramimonas_sp.AAC.1
MEWDFDPAAIRACCKKFKARTALGSDNVHPRDLLHVSDECLLALAGLWKAILRLGHVPSQMKIILVAMIEKPDGGHRPIGLLSAFVRVMSRMLRRAAVSWERDHQREYFYGSAGRSCERAVWEQSAMG